MLLALLKHKSQLVHLYYSSVPTLDLAATQGKEKGELIMVNLEWELIMVNLECREVAL